MKKTPVTAVVMVGERDDAQSAVAWIQQARRLAAKDLMAQLAQQPLVERTILASPHNEEFEGAEYDAFVSTAPGPIHVGQQLASLVEEFDISHLLYFGGGSAPLLQDDALGEIVEQLAAARELVITNNQFASDWFGITPAASIAGWVPRLPRDNMFAWVLSSEAGLPVEAQPVEAASRLDIDTPIDLLALLVHPDTRPNLATYLQELPLPRARLEKALQVLGTPASHAYLTGRIGPDVWSAINRATRSWLRIVSEERGMVSSGRQARGEVRSMVAEHIEVVGMRRYFELLAKWSEVAFIDSRVLLAHHGLWPNAASRFASDLGQVEQVEDDWLRAFTEAATQASIPVILGGHGLMSGAMLAFCSFIERNSTA
jgi:hypothetical protein